MKFTRLGRAAVIAVAIGLSTLPAAAFAQACSGGADHFLATLEAHGITMDPSMGLRVAETVCTALAEGETVDTLIDRGTAGTGLTAEDFGYVVEQSVHFFCPESAQQLPH
jgi:hypothetical protein